MSTDIYSGSDPRELPTYPVTVAARYLRLPVSTLRSWVRGRPYGTPPGVLFFEPPIALSDADDDRLSFSNLVEAHVLRALRTRHGVSMRYVRAALEHARVRYGIDRLLLHRDLRATPGNVFLERYGELLNLGRGSQLAMREILDAHLERVGYGSDATAVRFFPWLTESQGARDKTVAIDPAIAFGTPVTVHRNIRTAVIADRYESGETIEDIARDYEIEREEVRDAITYERAA